MSDKLQTLDVTALAGYLEKVKDISSINKMMGPTYLRYFIEGQDVCGVMLAKAIQRDIKAKSLLDQAKSIAYLDRASDYLKSKDMSLSNENRRMYVDIDADVIAAADEKAKSEAVIALLKNRLSILRQAHDDLKKILYGDQQLTPYEGM